MNALKNHIMKYMHNLVDGDDDIHHKLLKLVLLSASAGGFVSLVVSIVLGYEGLGTVFVALLTLTALSGLVIAERFKKIKLAAILVDVIANFVLFPVLYFVDGGMSSGMPIWLMLGLIFSLLLLEGNLGVVMYVANIIVVAICIIAESLYPGLVKQLPSGLANGLDKVQSIIIVTCVFGMILKFQAFVYEKQKKELEEHESELQETMRQLRKANQAKSDFLANMSHEIRTPINAVLGMDEMILRESKERDVIQYAANIQSSGQTLLSLINDVLDFSKIESGKMELVPVEYEFYSVMNDCYNMISTRANEKKLELRVINDPMIPSRIYGDEVRVRQILSNLLTNAVKYTARGSVTLKAGWEWKADGQMVLRFSVKDTGMGISEENQKQLFTSFKRLDEKKNRSIEGTGLGLTITKHLVEMMDGTITVESEYGRGSEFIVELPQGIVDERPTGDFMENHTTKMYESKYEESFQAPDALVLVVDDVQMNLDVFKALLKQTRVQVDMATSGMQCLQMIQDKKYDIIFMDHMMPELDGIETLHEMNRMMTNKNRTTPVIALTANAVMGAREKYLEEGFASYLSKPVRGVDLEAAVRKYLPASKIFTTGNGAAGSVKAAEAPIKEKTFVQKADFLNTKTALQFCGDSEELFQKVVTEYAHSDVMDKLNYYYQQKDVENYRITVHALKSTSKTIGAMELFNEAKRMEDYARDNDWEAITVGHDLLVDNYLQLMEKIKKII